MNDTQPLGTSPVGPAGTLTAEHPASASAPGAGVPADAASADSTSAPARRLGWWPMVAVAVTAVLVGALLGFGLGRVSGGSTSGPGGFGGPGRAGFQGGPPGQQFGGAQPGQQLGGQPGQ